MIDEGLLPGAMLLAHDDVEFVSPLPIQFAVPTVVVSLRMGFPILLPQQLQGDALAALQFLVDGVEAWHWPTFQNHR